mgnify:CR=1 FL=1
MLFMDQHSCEEIIKEVTENLKNYLIEKGYRKTPERFIILKEIYEYREHFDVDTFYTYLKNKKIHISKATLYNTLDILVEAGLVVKHQFGDSCAQYEPSYRLHKHSHAICIKCKKIFEFSSDDLQKIIHKFEEENNFEVTNHTFVLYGICSDCKMKV